MTTLYLAWGTSMHVVDTLRDYPWEERPISVLSTFYGIKQWNRFFAKYPIRAEKYMLDSGAYSAWNSKKSIDIEALLLEAKNPFWDEVVALDVIGDPVGSLRNAKYMKRQGSRSFPVFHIGESWSLLREYCSLFDKVGLSCRFGESEKESWKWLDQCFAREWPKKFHSFGYMSKRVCTRYPFHTADSSSWTMAASAFGRWCGFGLQKIPVHGRIDHKVNAFYFADLQKELRFLWKKEMMLLDTKPSSSESRSALQLKSST